MYENISTIVALAFIVAICAGYLAWREIRQAAANMAAYDLRVKAWGEEQARKAAEDEAQHRRMVHEADSKPVSMEPSCDTAYTRSREAVARAQKAARDSMNKP